MREFYIHDGTLLGLYIRLHSVCAHWAGLCIRLLWNFASLISPGLVEHTVLLLWTIIIINIISKLHISYCIIIYSLISPGGTHSSLVLNHDYYQYYIKIKYYIFTDPTRWNTQFSFYSYPTLPMKFQFQISLRCLCACCGGFP